MYIRKYQPVAFEKVEVEWCFVFMYVMAVESTAIEQMLVGVHANIFLFVRVPN